MQQTTSFARAAHTRRISPAMAALSAAAIASAITVLMTMSNSAVVSAQDQATTTAAAAGQCRMVARKLLVSTTSGSGTVRLREGNYLSPSITLSAVPQPVVFPLPRPEITPVEDVVSIEGNANDVVITSDVTNFRKVFDVSGVAAFNVSWRPLKTC